MARLITSAKPGLVLGAKKLAALKQLITVNSDLVVTVLKQTPANVWNFESTVKVLPQGGTARLPLQGELEAHWEFSWGLTPWSTFNPPGVVQVLPQGVFSAAFVESDLRFGNGWTAHGPVDSMIRIVVKHIQSGATIAQELTLNSDKSYRVGNLVVVDQGNQMPADFS